MQSKSITILAIMLSLAGQEWICLTHQHCLNADCHVSVSRHRHETKHACRCARHKHSARHTQHRSVAVRSNETPAPGDPHTCCAECSPVIAETEPCQFDVLIGDLKSIGSYRRSSGTHCHILCSRMIRYNARLHIMFCSLLC